MDARALLRRYGDALLAVALAVGITLELLRWPADDVASSIGAGLLATAPLAVRRRNPLASFLLVMLGLELLVRLEPGFDNDSMAFVVAFFVSLYSLGRHASGTEAWLGVVGVLVAMVSFIDGEGGFGQVDPGDIAFVLVFVGAPVDSRADAPAQARTGDHPRRRERPAPKGAGGARPTGGRRGTLTHRT